MEINRNIFLKTKNLNFGNNIMIKLVYYILANYFIVTYLKVKIFNKKIQEQIAL